MAAELPVGARELLASPLIPFCEPQVERFNINSIKVGDVKPFDVMGVSRRLSAVEGLPSVFAIDMGGKSIRGDLWLRHGGRLVPSRQEFTQRQLISDEGAGYLAFMEQVAEDMLGVDVGLSVAGPLDGTRLDHAPNMTVLEDELANKYRRDFAAVFPDRKAVVMNDAEAGTKASAVEAAQVYAEERPVLYLINGSGLGGALFLEGKIIPMEAGHVQAEDALNVFDRKFECKMDQRGGVCLESVVASKAGIEQMWFEQTDQQLSGFEISDRYASGDLLARLMYDHSASGMAHMAMGVKRAFGISDRIWEKTIVALHGGTAEVPGYAERFEQYLDAYSGRTNPELMLTKSFSDNACQRGAAIGALFD